jgi:hypothetical protein
MMVERIVKPMVGNTPSSLPASMKRAISMKGVARNNKIAKRGTVFSLSSMRRIGIHKNYRLEIWCSNAYL